MLVHSLPSLPSHLCIPAQIRVLPSQSKNRLYLGNLPKTITKDELDAQVRAATKGALICMLCLRQHVYSRQLYAEGRQRIACYFISLLHYCVCHRPGKCRAADVKGDSRPEPGLLLPGVLQSRLRTARQGSAVAAQLPVRPLLNACRSEQPGPC